MQIIHRLTLLTGFGALFGVVPLANGQRVQGTVTGRNEQPVSGVVLLLLDDSDAVAGRALSGERGEFRLIAPSAGSYHLRTLRIGFTPVTSRAFHLDAGQVRNELIRLTNIPYTLEPARVTSRSVCPRTSPESLAIVFAAWEQVRTALYAATLTVTEGHLDATTLRYSRMLDRNLTNVLAQQNEFRTAAVRDPWLAVAADTLHERGYVRTGTDDSVTYAAPSVDALASDSFFADHCFSFAVGPDDQRRIVFEPSSDRRRIPEVRGVVSMDRETGELRRVEYSYVNLSTLQMTQAGGEVEFARLRSGEWLIPRWSVRMPVLGVFAGFGSRSLRVTRIKVDGGQLIAAVRDGDTLWRHPLLAMSGQLLDSVTRQPIADAHLSLTGTKLEANTQSDGSFRIAGVLPGAYAIQVRGPGSRYAGMVVAVPVVFTDSASPVSLVIPTAAQVAAFVCGNERVVAAVSGLAVLTGHVDATLVPEGRDRPVVTADWPDVTIRFDPAFRRFVSDTVHVSRATTVDERGDFHICFIPATGRVTVRADAGDVRALPKTVRVPEGQHFVRVELLLDSNLEPVTTLAGLVLDDSLNHPIAGVEVALPDLGLFSRTDDRGVVRIGEIPLGRNRIQLHRDGFVEHDTVVVLERSKVMDLRVLLHAGKGNGGIVSGTLTDIAGHPFQGARIQVDTLPEVRSGANGTFIVRGVPGGTRQLEILALGMRPLTMTVDVRPPDTARVSAVVDRLTQLETVRIAGTTRHSQFVKELHERQRTGQGSVMDSTQFGRQATMAAVMAGFNSVHIQNTSKSARTQFVVLLPYSGRSCAANIWIDRVLSQPDDLIALHPEDIAVVELFPYRLSVPLEFTNPLSDCGAVVVWTKLATQ